MTLDILSKQSPVWRYFFEICQVPRPSGFRDRIVEYVAHVGHSLKLETIVDDLGNVLIRKKASSGLEAATGVILQAHLDMVAQKASNVVHDFHRDPIHVMIDNGYVRAEGTTLGADNGIGMAMILAILSDTTLCHPPIEALFTVDEESTMAGIRGVPPGLLTGKILLNLDMESVDAICVGSAGASEVHLKKTMTIRPAHTDSIAYRVTLSGLTGGHSGMDIHLNRGNAIKILSDLLRELPIEIADFDGGELKNAIPRSAKARIVFSEHQEPSILSYLCDKKSELKNHWQATDPALSLQWEKIRCPAHVFEQPELVFDLIAAIPNGVVSMVPGETVCVDTSNNLGRVVLSDGRLRVISLVRSLDEQRCQDVVAQITRFATDCQAFVEIFGGYPSWTPDWNSPLLAKAKSIYECQFGRSAQVQTVHAGLECSLLQMKYPNLSCLSLGPTIESPHSPSERLAIDTVLPMYEFINALLANVSQVVFAG